jgi:pimeloyl-ACP methyl ester carboxylesterase
VIVVALHGAFRGGWYWEPMAEVLAGSGHRVVAPDLVGESLAEWLAVAADAVSRASDTSGEQVTLVGHSMGGMVAQGLPRGLAPAIGRFVLLDAPLVDPGSRPVDVSSPSPVDDALLPGRDHRAQPAPVGPEQGFTEPRLADWVNRRLRPVPMGPQLDPLPAGLGRPPGTVLVFFDRTPGHFPSALARRRCEEDGVAHTVLDQHHDAPVLDPAAVAAVVAGGA